MLHGGRISVHQIKDAASRAAIAELGAGEWIAEAGHPTLYRSKIALGQTSKDVVTVLTKIVYALRSFPGLKRSRRPPTSRPPRDPQTRL
jgi:hypothetical protein